MDFEKLADDLIGIVKAAAPLVGLSDEVAAAEALIKSIKGAVDTVEGALDPDQRHELEAGLDALADRVSAHAERTKSAAPIPTATGSSCWSMGMMRRLSMRCLPVRRMLPRNARS